MSRSGNAFAIKDPCSPQRSRFPSTGFKKKLRSSLRPCSKKDTHPVVRGHRRVVPVVCKACRFSPLSAAEDVTLNPFAYIRMNIQHIDSNMLADKKSPRKVHFPFSLMFHLHVLHTWFRTAGAPGDKVQDFVSCGGLWVVLSLVHPTRGYISCCFQWAINIRGRYEGNSPTEIPPRDFFLVKSTLSDRIPSVTVCKTNKKLSEMLFSKKENCTKFLELKKQNSPPFMHIYRTVVLQKGKGSAGFLKLFLQHILL